MPIPDIFAQTLEQILGYGIGGAVTPVVEWAARPIAYEVNAAEPNMVLDPPTLAVVQVRRAGTGYDGAGEAAKSGINGARFAELIDTVTAPPATGEVLELMRRAVMGEEKAKQALQQGGLNPEWIDAYLHLAEVLLSPSDLAMARQQGFVTVERAHSGSKLQGVSTEDADILFEMSGLPPGADTAVELLARGEIDDAEFAQMIREGHTKTKYIDTMKMLRWQPLSASVAAEALIRERMTEEKAVQIAEQNRIRKEDFLLWSNMLGRPMGIGQALTLVRRGEMDATAFKEVVARSDVRTEYTDDLLKLKRVIPPLFQISRLLAAGSLTDDLAVKYITEEGYDLELAHSIVDGAHKSKTAGTHHITASMIDQLYESGLETHDWAITALKGIGYADDDAELHLEILDARRLLSALQSDLTVIHREYVTHKISVDEASADLDELGIRHEVRDTLLDTWAGERKAAVKRLTDAQIGQALKYNIISVTDAIARWVEHGYPVEDATALAGIAEKGPVGAAPTTA